MKGTITLELLKQVNPKIELTIDSAVSASEYFTTREGLWVSSGFTERVLRSITPSKSEQVIESWELLQDAADPNIELALENTNVFNTGDVCSIVATLIEKQKKGEEGTLDNSGKWNLFYTPTCVVFVGWYSSDGEWNVSAWRRGGSGWRAGNRVFSPVN